MAEQYANAAATTLNGAINNSVTSITVTSASTFPSTAPFRILVQAEGSNTNELMVVTAGAGTTSWTVTRAAESYAGSASASAHASSAVVKQVLTVGGLYASIGSSIVAGFDAGTSAITGNPEVDVVAPANGTILSWTILADQSGSAVIDIWKDTYGNSPPTIADTITASAKPTLTSAVKATGSTLTGWTTSLTSGDVLRFHLDSSSTVHRVILTLLYTRTP